MIEGHEVITPALRWEAVGCWGPSALSHSTWAPSRLCIPTEAPVISFIINLTELKCHSRNRHFVLLYQPFHLAPEKPSRHHLSRIIFSFRTGDLRVLGATRASYPFPSGSEQPLNLVVGDECLCEDASEGALEENSCCISNLLLLLPRMWRHRCRRPA